MSQEIMLDPSMIEPVETTAAWVVGGLVLLVGGILAFVQRLILEQFKSMRTEINQLRSEMLDVMRQSLDMAVTNGNGQAPQGRRKPPG